MSVFAALVLASQILMPVAGEEHGFAKITSFDLKLHCSLAEDNKFFDFEMVWTVRGTDSVQQIKPNSGSMWPPAAFQAKGSVHGFFQGSKFEILASLSPDDEKIGQAVTTISLFENYKEPGRVEGKHQVILLKDDVRTTIPCDGPLSEENVPVKKRSDKGINQ